MQFQTYQYLLIFLPIVLGLYHVVRTNPSYTTSLLYISSLIFYGYSGWPFVLCLIFSATIDFFIGRAIYNANGEPNKKKWLYISLLFNLSVLCVVKYSGWLTGETQNLFQLFGLKWDFVAYTIPLIPGISFYTFQTLSYTIDIYKGIEKPHKSYTAYLSFVTFFPQLIAGPIERSVDLLPQLEKIRSTVSSKEAAAAIFLICWGVFKKLVFADNFGDIVNSADLTKPGMGLLYGYAFALQIYCDFSAYSDIALGSAKLFNVNLTTNFKTPFLSTNPSEFWRRWHISLSTWIRDYVFIPLGGSRNGPSRTLINLIITMFLCGLWHGAGVNFILWGLYHGALLVLYYLFPIHEKLTKLFGDVVGKIAGIFLFFNLGAFGWIMFRAKSLGDIGQALRSIGDLFTTGASAEFIHSGYIFIIFALPLLISEIIAWRKDTEYPNLYRTMPVWLKTAHYLVFFYAVLWLGKRVSSEFIYFQF